MKAWTVPAMFPVPEIMKAFDENGNPIVDQFNETRLANFISELFWCIEAKSRMEDFK
jgi:hypothetical protein